MSLIGKCCICDKEDDSNIVEPRFYYTVCIEHSKLSPVQVSRIVHQKEQLQIAYSKKISARPN